MFLINIKKIEYIKLRDLYKIKIYLRSLNKIEYSSTKISRILIKILDYIYLEIKRSISI